MNHEMAQLVAFLAIVCKQAVKFGTRLIFCFGSIGNGRCDMSFGKMNGFADIIITKKIKDSEGFHYGGGSSLLSAYIGRVVTEVCGGQISPLFPKRLIYSAFVIPNLIVTTEHFIECDGERFHITSVENVKGRGMYIEVLAEKVVATNGKS